MKEYWGKQRGYTEANGYAKQYEPENPNGYAKQYEPESPNGYAKQYEEPDNSNDDMRYARDKSYPKPCEPPKPCADRQCHFCGTEWRKCPCCGKCCCCKVWHCGHLYVFLCGDCNEVFFADCEEGCWKK